MQRVSGANRVPTLSIEEMLQELRTSRLEREAEQRDHAIGTSRAVEPASRSTIADGIWRRSFTDHRVRILEWSPEGVLTVECACNNATCDLRGRTIKLSEKEVRAVR